MERRQSLSASTRETLVQSQSPLFGKLPLEIRSQIWEYALDFGEPLHVVSQDDLRGRHYRIADCERYWREFKPSVDEYSRHTEIRDPPTSSSAHGRCCEIFLPASFDNAQIPYLPCERWRPLSLLQSCRRM